MQIAFVIFDQMTALDFVGVYDPLTRLKTMNFMPELRWDICARTRELTDDRALRFTATKVDEPLTGYDAIVVAGGYGTRALMHDAAFIAWLRTAAPCPLKTSVCTGSLLLGAAGFLAGRRATTHPSAYRDLAPCCASVTYERIVADGDVVTAGGVTAGIDLGLYLVERFAGAEVRALIARQMDYPYATTNNQI
ncbi:MAG: thiamine biosynthesis protein ThiJ [Acidobacteria bacterium]|nr:MAG: thiamine biosynthesis protein ThiJ [Acidobacteriota bacterium]